MSSDILAQDQTRKLTALREIVLAARQESPLYQEKYQTTEIPHDFDRIAFAALPLLARDEYYKGMKPMDFPLLIGGIPGTYIFTSGGTTGDVKLTAWDQDFVENWVKECFKSLSQVGLEKNDIVINLFFPGIWATHTLINKALEKAKCRIIPLGGKVSLDLLLEYIKKLQVTALIGVPSFIVSLAEYIESLPDSEHDGINLKKIWWAGEFLSPNQTEFIKKSLNCQVHPFIYSSTDTGTIGMKCEHCATNQYHIADSIYLETLDPDTAEAVPVGSPGEFVVTSLVNAKAPCIRYRVGDMGLIADAPCPCGNSAPLFTLKGRADDEVKVAGYLINPNIVQQGMEHFSTLLSRNFQLVVEEEGKKAKLTVICEVLPSFAIDSDPDLPERVASHVAASYDILEELIAREYCLPLEIRMVPPDTIPRNPRTGKIKRVRDLR